MLKKSVDSIWQYYKDYIDDDTIYIKLDDDICFFEMDAVKNLIEHRINNPKPLFVFGNIVYARHGRELMGCKSPIRESC